MSYEIYIAYALTFIIPSAIVGFGAFANNIKTSILLGWISLMSFLAYYNYVGLIPTWITIFVLIIISLIFMVLFNSMFGGGGE